MTATLDITPYEDQAGELRYRYQAEIGEITEIGQCDDGYQVSAIIQELRDKAERKGYYLQVNQLPIEVRH